MKRIAFFATAAFMVGAFMISCNNHDAVRVVEVPKPVFNLDSARKEIEAVNRAFMDFVVKGDTVGIGSLYTSDAKLMFANSPTTVGRANIQSVFAGILKSGVTRVNLETKEVFGSEDLLVEEGEATIYVKDMVVGQEKTIVIWKKEDGKWKLFRDIANSNK